MPKESQEICEFITYIDLFPRSYLLHGSTRPGIKPKLEALRNLYEGKKIIVGRDKLDVVKGVIQKVSI